jgi:hypothetical protein
LLQSFQSYPEVVAPGSPSPEPIATTLTEIAQRVSVKSGQTFAGQSGLYGLHSAETDALASGLESTASTTDTYEALVTVGASTQLLDYGSQYRDESGDTASTVPSPATILDELPENAGAAWSNGPAATIDEALAGDAKGSAITVVRRTNADGSYTEKTTYPPNYSATGVTGVGTVQENSDGSGTFTLESNGGILTLTYSPPEPQASGPPLITIDEYDGTDTTAAPAETFQLASWYGSTPALYAETDRDDGSVTLPSSCGLAAALPTKATLLSQTLERTDTVLGYIETQTFSSYVAPGYGLVCTVLSDRQTSYYDFNGDEPFVFTETPPLEIATAAETLALQPAPAVAASAHAAVAAAPAALTAVLRARFDLAVARARRRRVATLLQRLLASHLLGGLR